MYRKENWAALFDLDGVVLDTEGQYDHFWADQGMRYHPEIPGFNKKIKGQTIGKILVDYFGTDVNLQRQILRELDVFESRMDFPYVAGAEAFICSLLSRGVKTALVTSSTALKMYHVTRAHPEFSRLFQCVITADEITRSKPDPECYLLAAKELRVEIDMCHVFEDSLSGIAAGRNAGMKVIGLATTLPREIILPRVDRVIVDFEGYVHAPFMDQE